VSRPWDWHVLDLPADPVPGDPVAVRRLGADLLRFAEDVDRSRVRLRGLTGTPAVTGWEGLAGDAFRAELHELPGELDKLFTTYDLCGQAVAQYAPALERAQDQADEALHRGRLAHADLSAQTLRLAGAQEWSEVAERALLATSAAPAPDPVRVRAAVRDVQAARVRVSQLQEVSGQAQDRLDAARRLALQAQELRDEASRRAEAGVRAAAEAGIAARSVWHRVAATVRGSWDDVVTVAKVVVLVLGLVVLICGGPLAWVVMAAAVVVLADTLSKFAAGEASLWDVALAALDCVPGLKGLTTVGRLGELARSGRLVRAGAAAAAGRLRSMASAVRQGATHVRRITRDLPRALSDSARMVELPGTGARLIAMSLGPVRQVLSMTADVPGGAALPPVVPLTEDLFDHLYPGEIVKNRLGGYHHRPDGSDLPGRWIPEDAEVVVDPVTGAYSVDRLAFLTHTGAVAHARKTFFPDGWSPQRVREVVTGAWNGAGRVLEPGSRSWTGEFQGFRVEGFYDPATGRCRTAFPRDPGVTP
jgi:Bacterial EndoU nuclease/Protein of unknown function (DUF3619)